MISGPFAHDTSASLAHRPLQVLKEANVIIEWRRMIMKFPVSALFAVAVAKILAEASVLAEV
jgi:hypothetical protein